MKIFFYLDIYKKIIIIIKYKNLKLFMKYLKLFDLDADYQAFIGGGSL